MGTSGIVVSVSEIGLDESTRGFGIKIQAGVFELNVSMSIEELQMLPDIKNAHWEDRSSLRIGSSAGSPAWWSCDEGVLSILVGEDDEYWDFGVTLPVAVVDDILADIENQRLGQGYR